MPSQRHARPDAYYLAVGFRVFLDGVPARILRDDGDTLVAVAEHDHRRVARVRKPEKRRFFQLPVPWQAWWVGEGEVKVRRDNEDCVTAAALTREVSNGREHS